MQDRDRHVCATGDITVSESPDGCVIRRVRDPIGRPGGWWEYIASVQDLDVAIELARSIARQRNVKAWVLHAHEYHEIPT